MRNGAAQDRRDGITSFRWGVWALASIFSSWPLNMPRRRIPPLNATPLNYERLLDQHSWLIERDRDCVLSPDCDGFLSGLLYSNVFNWRVRGFYDGKVLLHSREIRPSDCVFLDMDVFRPEVKSVGHHMVCYSFAELPANWASFQNCVQLNNLRGADALHYWQNKYPFGTVHFLIGLLQFSGNLTEISEDAHWPLLFADGVANNLLGYPENCLQWLAYLEAPPHRHVLHQVVAADKTLHEIMMGMDVFFRIRDDYNARGTFSEGDFKSGRLARSGHKLRISRKDGEAINVEGNHNGWHIHARERERVEGFVTAIGERTGWTYVPESWSWENLTMRRFTKGSMSKEARDPTRRLNQANYLNLVDRQPISWVFRSGNSLEYTLPGPDNLP